MSIAEEVSSSDFLFDELFFSRTDKKGIIQSGNSVFQRISEFEWDEILNRPHRVVRHPHMPRGIFHLMWNEILSDHMIGAYVANKTKKGKYYWVFALVSPIENGFLSVRLKPSSQLFKIIKDEYAKFHAIEKDQKISPEESQDLILSHITKLGFESYWHFMVEALMQELESREVQLEKSPIKKLQILREALKFGAKIETAKIKTKSEDIISLINQLSVFKDSLKNGLREIEEYGLNLSKQTEEMSTLLEKEA
ncbi:MAG: hypothetical protein WCY48_03770 [Candidatus Caldatribacteriota bacterium]